VREAQELSSSPSPDYTATPLESDLFEWHFTLRGPPNSCYADGLYHGRIVLPASYPLRPPSFRFSTPSGRFEPNREICLSISGHHEETWQPAWGVRTALVALRSFMETDPRGQLGGLDASDAARRKFAADSRAWRCPACARRNDDIMAECVAAANEAGGGAAEVAVPSDLKMGWRDEMGNQKEAAKAAEGSEDAESARLAEGFVQTAPSPPSPPEAVPVSAPARPGQGVPQPTRTVPLPGARPHPHTANMAAVQPAAPVTALRQAVRARPSGEAVPLWIDRMIVAVSVVLAGMVLKMMYRATQG
jgi:ubiquitin-conjugating enzyme E2 J1